MTLVISPSKEYLMNEIISGVSRTYVGRDKLLFQKVRKRRKLRMNQQLGSGMPDFYYYIVLFIYFCVK